MELHKKIKGSIAELAVAVKLMEYGYHSLFPFGENSRYDLVCEKDGCFIKIQVKYVTPKNGALELNCKSSNNWFIDKYTADEIDFIGAYNSDNKEIYFIPSDELNSSVINLRFVEAKNRQKAKVRNARDFLKVP